MPLPSDVAQQGTERGPAIRSFVDEGKGIARLEFVSVEEGGARGGASGEALASMQEQVAALEAKLHEQAAEAHRQVEETKLLTRLLARKEWDHEFERRLEDDRVMVRQACEDFDKERTRYFAAVEGQVVKLALAIAGRVLHREARMDPMLLTAAVRVALEKVEQESETTLRVPVGEVGAWSRTFGSESSSTTSGREVRVVGDETMGPGECVLETSVGKVELGIEAQMAEIERGFFDLLEKRPA